MKMATLPATPSPLKMADDSGLDWPTAKGFIDLLDDTVLEII